jgi:hypothetical protein
MKIRYHIVASLIAFSLGGVSHKLYATYHHPLKHTWDCQVIARPSEHIYWFMRPNREIFEAYFDNPPILAPGMTLKDVAYTDDNADLRHFVRATMAVGGGK